MAGVDQLGDGAFHAPRSFCRHVEISQVKTKQSTRGATNRRSAARDHAELWRSASAWRISRSLELIRMGIRGRCYGRLPHRFTIQLVAVAVRAGVYADTPAD